MDIVIYMNEEDFLHKTGEPTKEDPESGPITAFWSMGRIPRHFNVTDEDNDCIWLASKGAVRGSVQCEEFRPEDINGETIIWDSRTYVRLAIPIPCKPFRSFRYKWWNKENNGRKKETL